MRLASYFYTGLLLFVCCVNGKSQERNDSLQTLLSKYLDETSAKSKIIDGRVDKATQKTLARLEHLEDRINSKYNHKDSTTLRAGTISIKHKYDSLRKSLQNSSSAIDQYIPSLDTLTSGLAFLKANPELIANNTKSLDQLMKAIQSAGQLKADFQHAEQIKKFLAERRNQLEQQFQSIGFVKEFKRINKGIYYYSQQINEYKSLLADHKKATGKALQLLSQSKIFQEFMKRNSQLASMFRLPGSNGTASSIDLTGLQTRESINTLLQQQLLRGGPNAQSQFQQSIREAQGQLQSIQNRLRKSGIGSNDDIMPEGFKPNQQKTKTFLQRLEYGTNFQSQRANGYFPVTTDMGLSLGYKLNDKSIIGIGVSYKLGWGPNIRHIKFTHQGAGLRSFLDIKLKGSFWISGGYEMNYRTAFNRFAVLENLNAWQQSGLIGMSKVVSLQTKFFKKTKVQLLWDFMSYRQVPRTQPLLFRLGYNLK